MTSKFFRWVRTFRHLSWVTDDEITHLHSAFSREVDTRLRFHCATSNEHAEHLLAWILGWQAHQDGQQPETCSSREMLDVGYVRGWRAREERLSGHKATTIDALDTALLVDEPPEFLPTNPERHAQSRFARRFETDEPVTEKKEG